jgi:hypothetical protein
MRVQADRPGGRGRRGKDHSSFRRGIKKRGRRGNRP